jgi:hypothetical protein
MAHFVCFVIGFGVNDHFFKFRTASNFGWRSRSSIRSMAAGKFCLSVFSVIISRLPGVLLKEMSVLIRSSSSAICFFVFVVVPDFNMATTIRHLDAASPGFFHHPCASDMLAVILSPLVGFSSSTIFATVCELTHIQRTSLMLSILFSKFAFCAWPSLPV